MMHSPLAVVLFATLGLTGITIAAEAAMVAPDKIADVRDVRAQPDQVSGVLVNRSSKPVRNVQLRIDRFWLWKNEHRDDGRFETPVSVVSLERVG